MYKIQLGPNLCFKKKRQYEDLLCKYIHLFVFSYKDLKEITMEQNKVELLPNAKPIRTKQREVEFKIHYNVEEGT